ncbi:hypothetical protein ES703_31872 [subsurface metagenome]
MVKIINTLGDVKVGKQGEVVYQRKYGEQIRRTASPKRAIPSQRQIEHRQLYRQALAWRSQLLPANRRYLEGYCIANGIVDRYQIALPWSRFALKLYLEHVDFVIITKPIPGEEAEEELFENYQVETLGLHKVYDKYWRAQTFTPLVSHKITKMRLYINRRYDPGDITLSIRNTDENGHPTGQDLVAVTYPVDYFPIHTTDWYDFIFPNTYDLVANTKYAAVLRTVAGNSNEYVNFYGDWVDPTYTRGTNEQSANFGSTWATLWEKIFYFEEYGITAGAPPTPGLLHVRHPALLTIVHKRGKLAPNGYDTLSSLDEEYLTTQVGLDVQKGDEIKVTTLPGIEYAYQIV